MNHPDTKWQIYNTFKGTQTKDDAEKIDDGAASGGQNTTSNDGDRISIRSLGYEQFADFAYMNIVPLTTNKPIRTLHTFRKRDGSNVLMATFGTYIAYWNDKETWPYWETLKDDCTDNKDFDFADYNINSDLHSYTYFGNGVDNWMRWNGAYTYLTADLNQHDTVVNVNDTTGFDATGNIVIDGRVIAYTLKTGTTFLISDAPENVTSDWGVAQEVEEDLTNPKGNIYLVSSNRLFIAGVLNTPQADHFSKYGDATDFSSDSLVTGSTATSSGVFNLGEGGGGIIAQVQDEGSIYILKRGIVYKAGLTDEFYSILPLKPFDGKSQTIGATSRRGVFTGGNSVFMTTTYNQIVSLERIEQIDYPQASNISEIIKPTVDILKFDTAVGITFKDQAFFSVKSSINSSSNDKILIWRLPKKQGDRVVSGWWDTPITGWNANDFTVYDNGITEDLYFGSSLETKVYKVINEAIDGDNGVQASWKTKQYTFGDPQSLKLMDDLFIEGYISNSTILTITLYLDEEGFTQTYQTTINGFTNTDYIFSLAVNNPSNPIGENALGETVLGSAKEGKKNKFRVYLDKDTKFPSFYNCQLEFSSDGKNQKWDIVSYGFKVSEDTQPIKTKLQKAFK